MPPPDPQLAFTRLFVAAQPALFGFLVSLVHDVHAADDLIQKLAERMWKKFGDYDESRPFVAWGMGFARILAMEWRRAQRRLPLPLNGDTLELLAEQAADHTLHHDERIDALHDCLRLLTDRQRSALRLHYQESVSVASIARSWKRSQVAVYKTLKHVHRTLLDCIEQALASPLP